jgi:hypothetical protein
MAVSVIKVYYPTYQIQKSKYNYFERGLVTIFCFVSCPVESEIYLLVLSFTVFSIANFVSLQGSECYILFLYRKGKLSISYCKKQGRALSNIGITCENN